jgi:hypothetical protein
VTVGTQPAGQTCKVANMAGILTSGNLTNVEVTCKATPTANITVASNSIIPYTGVGYPGGIGFLTVTNIGTNAAYSVLAHLPSGWTAVTQDSADCTSIAPNRGRGDLAPSSRTPH